MSLAEWEQAYYVKVSKDGLPTAAYDDTNCSRAADETVKALVNRVRFYPALKNGKPVEGVAELNFSKLVL